MKLLLATRNVKKLDELRRILAASPELRQVELVGLDDVPPYVEVPETGLTFAENALLKVRLLDADRTSAELALELRALRLQAEISKLDPAVRALMAPNPENAQAAPADKK